MRKPVYSNVIHSPSCRHTRNGFSLLELLAVVLILGIAAAITLPRFISTSDTTKQNACYVNKGEVELQTQLWFRSKGYWPNADLSDIGADAAYFPDGLPTCPVDGSSYTFDASTQRVIGHSH